MHATYTYYYNDLLDEVTYYDEFGGMNSGVRYTYDEANRLDSIEHLDSLGLVQLELTYDYALDDLPTTITERDGDGIVVATTNFDYDARNRLTREWRTALVAEEDYDFEYLYDAGGNRTMKVDNNAFLEHRYEYDTADPVLYGSANNRLMKIETWDISGRDLFLPDVHTETKWYYYNEAGNVTRVVSGPTSLGGGVMNMSTGGGTLEPQGFGGGEAMGFRGGCALNYSPRTVTRFIYTEDGQEVQYVLGEKWCQSSSSFPTDYQVTYGREFRYDGARQRYLNRNLDPVQLESDVVADLTAPVWSDYDGNAVYGDFEIPDTTAVEKASYQPGMGRTDAWASSGSTNTKYYTWTTSARHAS